MRRKKLSAKKTNIDAENSKRIIAEISKKLTAEGVFKKSYPINIKIPEVIKLFLEFINNDENIPVKDLISDQEMGR